MATTGSPIYQYLPRQIDMPDQTQPYTMYPAVTYDGTRNQDVSFGGCTSGVSTPCTAWDGTTWTYNGTIWTKLAPSVSPSARTESNLVYDPKTGTSVLFGGQGSGGALSDTWTWNGTTWSQVSPSAHPSARYGAVAAYLPSTGLVYLFGGQSSSSSYLSDTWSWNGTTWTQLSPSAVPPARALSALAYSGTAGATANDLVLYGGATSSGDIGDTWSFNGTSWSQLSPAGSPGPIDSAGFTYDPAMNTPYFFGGLDNGSMGPEPMVWNGTNWVAGDDWSWQLSGFGQAQDPANGQLIQTGGDADVENALSFETFKIDYQNARPTSQSLLTKHLSSQLTQVVDPVDTSLHFQLNDLSVPDVGIPLNFQEDIGLTGEGCGSYYLGCFATLGLIDVTANQVPNGELLQMADGTDTYCPYSAASSTWTCTAGSGLTYNGSTVVDGHAGLTYTFNPYGSIATVANRNGNRITFNYAQTGGASVVQATTITDTEGRTTTLAYSNGLLSTITDPLGRQTSFTFNNSTTEPELTAVAVSQGSQLATTQLNYGLGSVWSVTTPAGRESTYQLGAMDRVTSSTQVTNTSSGTGDVTLYDAEDYNGPVNVTDPNGHVTTYTPTGYQITNVTDALGHSESASFNPDSDPTQLVNGLTQQSNLSWDSNDNLTAVTDPASSSGQTPASAAYSYATPTSGSSAVALGQYLPSSYTDAQNNCSSYGYDPTGNLTSSTTGLTPGSPQGTLPKGSCSGTNSTTTSTSTYQGDTAGSSTVNCGALKGEKCTSTTPGANVTTYGYNAQGQVTSVTQPGGSCVTGAGRKLCTTATYDADGEPLTVTDGKGQTTSYTYNELGEVTQVLYNGATTCTLSSGNCIQVGYDADGNVITRSDQTGPDNYSYDTLGRLTTDADYQRTVLGDKPAILWRLGDAPGSTTAADSSGGGHTGSFYANNGDINYGQTAPLTGDPTTAASFGGGANWIQTNEFAGVQNNGNFTDEIWATQPQNLSGKQNGATNLPALMGQGSNTEATGGGWRIVVNPNATFTYFRDNHSWTSTSAIPATGYHDITITYDGTTLRYYLDGSPSGTFTTSVSTNTNTSGFQVGNSDDAVDPDFDQGNLADAAVYTTTLSAAQVAAHYAMGATGDGYSYDAANNLINYTDAGGTNSYTYDNANRLTGVATPGGSCNNPAGTSNPCTTYGYNAANQNTNITFPASTAVTQTIGYNTAGNETSVIATKGSTTLESLSYGFTSGTNDRTLRQSVTNNITGVTTNYGYSPEDQLTSANQSSGGNYTYGYNADGDPTSLATPSGTTSLTYNADDQTCWTLNAATSNSSCAGPPSGVTSYTYDADGNLSSNTAGAAASYNALNQTTSLTPSGGSAESFAYTGPSSTQRVSAGSATIANNLFGVASTITNGNASYYAYIASGQELNSVGQNGNRYYYLYDGAGSINQLISSSGSVAATYTYDPYGNTTTSTNPGGVANPFRYQAGYTDNTGYIHFGNRYYIPSIAQWTQQDPSGQSPAYQYAADNPVDGADPTGLYYDCPASGIDYPDTFDGECQATTDFDSACNGKPGDATQQGGSPEYEDYCDGLLTDSTDPGEDISEGADQSDDAGDLSEQLADAALEGSGL